MRAKQSCYALWATLLYIYSSYISASSLVELERNIVLDEDAFNVWLFVGQFEKVGFWDKKASNISLNGTGYEPGDIRTVVIKNGVQTKDRLLSYDSSKMVFEYQMTETFFPFVLNRFKVKVNKLSDNQSQITLTVMYSPVAGEEQQTKQLVEDILDNSLEQLSNVYTRNIVNQSTMVLNSH